MKKMGLWRWLFGQLFMLIMLSVFAIAMESEKKSVPPGLTILETLICREMADNEPVGVAEVFSSDVKEVSCFNRITGGEDNTKIIHNWYFNEKLVFSVTLPVKSGSWRTYSSKAIPSDAVGDWKVEILTQDGRFLQKIYFLVN